MTPSKDTGFHKKEANQNKRNERSDQHHQELVAEVEEYVFARSVGTKHHKDDKAKDIQHDEAGFQRLSSFVHDPLLSLVVTLTCIILCASVPVVAVFFSLTFVCTMTVLAFFGFLLDVESRLGRTLDLLSRGRLIAILAAVALYPPLSLEQLRFFVGLSMLAGEAPPGLLPAITFAMLCAAQTGIALVLMVTAIPPRRVYAVLRRVADVLPAGMARWLRHRIAQGERHCNLHTGTAP